MESVAQIVEMENPFLSPVKAPSLSGTPLQQMSPDRLNQRLPQSPSLPLTFEQSSRKSHHRTSDASDVKARVAFLNSISQNGSPIRTQQSPSKNHAAIQRAIVGREEAETALNNMSAQLETAKSRERLVAERVESLMEQLQEARSRQRHERQVYEKEMKNSKKCEYKAELAVIKLQEEMKDLKNELEGFRVRADHDKAEKEKARQEAFERAYVVAGMTEEMQTLKEQLKAMEQDRDHAIATAASSMPAEPVTATQNRGVQTAPAANESVTGKRKQPTPTFDLPESLLLVDDMDLDDQNCSIEVKYAALQKEISWLRRQQKEDHELIHFMNMQCQFKACACRKAEEKGISFVYDYEYDRKVREQNGKKRKIEEEKPQEKMMPWKKRLDSKFGKKAIRPAGKSSNESGPEVEAMDIDVVQGSLNGPVSECAKAELQPLSAPAAPLPPADVTLDDTQGSEEVLLAEEAAQIPLPVSGEDTAQLEDFTQVIVEPSTTTQQFSFSTSVAGNKDTIARSTAVQQMHSTINLSDDLFNLSPPRKVPARPSTAMGILTVGSPIRLVPESPQPASVYGKTSQTQALSQTTRIALNDASPYPAMRPRQRSRSRPNMREATRGRSPVSRAAEIARPTSALSVGEATSPASSTMFPITPIAKHPRATATQHAVTGHRSHTDHTDQQPQHLLNSHDMLTEMTTTTIIPLKVDDDSFEPSESQQSTKSAPDSSSVYLKDTFNVPGTPITREAALAQIRARRDRARSVNMRQAAEQSHPDGGERASKGLKTPGSTARRGVKLDLGSRLGLTGERERGRDVSHASAPGRI